MERAFKSRPSMSDFWIGDAPPGRVSSDITLALRFNRKQNSRRK